MGGEGTEEHFPLRTRRAGQTLVRSSLVFARNAARYRRRRIVVDVNSDVVDVNADVVDVTDDEAGIEEYAHLRARLDHSTPG